MRRVFFYLAAATWMCLPAAAQNGYEIPRVIRIVRDELKPGSRAAYDRHRSTVIHAFAGAKFPMYLIGMSSVSGPEEFWTLEHYGTFAGVEETDRMLNAAGNLRNELNGLEAAGGALCQSRQTWLGVLRPELSYRTDAISNDMPKYRYVTVGTIHVRSGHDRDFAEFARTLVANYTKAGDERPYMTYQIVSGAPTGTYLVFAPLASLGSYDEASDRSRALRDVIGEENLREVSRRTADIITMTESMLFELRPEFAYGVRAGTGR